MIIRFWEAKDIPEIVGLGEQFYTQSNFEDGGYDPKQFEFTLNYTFTQKIHHGFVAEKDNKVVGFIIFDMARYYTTYHVAHLFLLYSGGSNSGRKLIKAADEYRIENGCKYFYVSGTAGIDTTGRNDKVLKYMYEKLGFEDNGFFMRKEL